MLVLHFVSLKRNVYISFPLKFIWKKDSISMIVGIIISLFYPAIQYYKFWEQLFMKRLFQHINSPKFWKKECIWCWKISITIEKIIQQYQSIFLLFATDWISIFWQHLKTAISLKKRFLFKLYVHVGSIINIYNSI